MSRRTNFGLVALLMIAGTSGASAAPARPWVAVSGAMNGYAMDHINEDIASLNAFLSDADDVDEINGGFSFGASVGLDFDRLSAAIAYERLLASTGQDDFYKYDLAGDAFVARGTYFVKKAGGTRIGVGAGAGVVSASGEFGDFSTRALGRTSQASRISNAGQAVILGPRVEVSGTSPYFEGFVQGDTRLGDRWSLAPAIGWRGAKIDGTWTGSQGSAEGTTDFSGWLARVAVKFALR